MALSVGCNSEGALISPSDKKVNNIGSKAKIEKIVAKNPTTSNIDLVGLLVGARISSLTLL